MEKCPSCGEKLTVSRRNIYEGFSVAGWEEKCIFCGFITAASADGAEKNTAADTAPAGVSGLAALLGEEHGQRKTVLQSSADERRFCRICRHFLQHPFTPRCAIDNHPVDPMDDCPQFALQEK